MGFAGLNFFFNHLHYGVKCLNLAAIKSTEIRSRDLLHLYKRSCYSEFETGNLVHAPSLRRDLRNFQICDLWPEREGVDVTGVDVLCCVENKVTIKLYFTFKGGTPREIVYLIFTNKGEIN